MILEAEKGRYASTVPLCEISMDERDSFYQDHPSPPIIEPESILSVDDYRNYRSIRAVALMYILIGWLLLVMGIAFVLNKDIDPENEHPPAIYALFAFIGLTGIIGGTIARRGNLKWSPVIYGMAVVHLIVIPIGTVMSIIMLSGLGRYLKSVERIQTFSDDSGKE